VRIRPLTEDDVDAVRELDRAAGQLFAGIGMYDVAAHEPTSAAELLEYRRAGHAWVAVDDADTPVAYLLVDEVDACAHVEQLSVHPDAGRQGIGRQLLDAVAAWAAAQGMPALTLITFRGVAWNGPYYERLGFRAVADERLGPGLRALRSADAGKGLDPTQRVCMRRPV
jgi:predicted N-acetyltransferase YhbS